MADPRQITDLPVATEANDVDLLLLRQGLFDKQVEVGFVRAGLLRASNNLSDVDDPVAARVNLGVDTSDFLVAANNLSDVDDPATARANLGVDTSDFLVAANNLSDLDNVVTARGNLDVVESALVVVNNDDNNYAFNVQESMQLKNYSETAVLAGNIDDTHSFNLEDGNVHSATVTDAVTISFTNPPASGQSGSLFLLLTNGGSAAVTWPGSVVWNEGIAPTLTETGVDLLVFSTVDNGTTWFGALAGKDMS